MGRPPFGHPPELPRRPDPQRPADAILNAAARLLSKLPQVTRVLVEGHTGSDGPADDNRTLSEARALSVYHDLVARGVDPARLSHRGYGETQPIRPYDSVLGRAANRRVVFRIVEVHGRPVLPNAQGRAAPLEPAPAP